MPERRKTKRCFLRWCAARLQCGARPYATIWPTFKDGQRASPNAIEMAGLSPTDRGERLCIDDYISLSDAVLAVLAESP